LGLVGIPWGKIKKETPSLEKYILKMKGNINKIIIPLGPKEGNPWSKPWEE
jgi:hypothetical protein